MYTPLVSLAGLMFVLGDETHKAAVCEAIRIVPTKLQGQSYYPDIVQEGHAIGQVTAALESLSENDFIPVSIKKIIIRLICVFCIYRCTDF